MVNQALGIGFFHSGKYDQVRSAYTPQLIPVLERLYPHENPMVVAEFGAGSGAFTHILLQSTIPYKKLFVIDPDQEGLAAHRANFSGHPQFELLEYIQSRSDNVPIQEQSIDLITAAHCFHWFDIEKTRHAWLRLLKPHGAVFILGRFLQPDHEATKAYIALTRFGKRLVGRKENSEAYIPEAMEVFFGHPVEKQIVCQEIKQKTLDDLKESIKIRIDTAGSEEIRAQEAQIFADTKSFFEQYQHNEIVNLQYETFYFYGPLNG
jgi:ubiquinone/menaquinone biosynthesis C-methylase UbiE